jgi:serine/threonine protein kinase
MPDPPKDAKGIFLAAVDMADAAERAAFVERSCRGDAALRQRVEDLLRAYGHSDGPLDKLAAAMASTKIAEPIPEQVGALIGPYKLKEQIGEGGFGLVFVAEQQHPIRRKVALKIIKPGMDTRDVIARFEAERQALALMDHPNIARVLDAGTTESGHPYFVMELVRGVPITEYCDKHQLTPRERLELFVPVCNAIQHAHLKGIIHRDIKPSNVLVTLHDGKPVVKVIDFGVAKALHQQLTDRTIYTRFAQMIGTPLYMSPEQAEMSGLDIDTRTDVYSLGVLLYELLTGMTPFDKKRLAKAAYDELLKIIREEEPPKPSLRLSQSSDSLPSIAALRRTEPAKLSKMFSGDLDWISMKALEKDRTRRYETVNAFAADVLRYLNDEPVEASRPSAGYRLRKLARKHRTALITAGSFAMLLIAGTVVSSWMAILAERAKQAAKAAETAAVESEQRVVSAFEEVRKERDETGRQLANGLLRPIGISDQSIDPGELRTFVDWSSIKESPVKLRVLEIALENPESALRVAGRAERVNQACVGLSPTRRAQAIKLFSARQRDISADQRVRVAACQLAMALDSNDLPAWEESCGYFSDPSNKILQSVMSGGMGMGMGHLGRRSTSLSSNLRRFVSFAARRNDPQEMAKLNLPLLEILETSTSASVLTELCSGLDLIAPRLDAPQTGRTWNALIAIVGKSVDSKDLNLGFVATRKLGLFVPRLDARQTLRTWNALIAIVAKSSESNDFNLGFGATQQLVLLAPRMEPAQIEHAVETFITILPTQTQNAVYGLLAFAPRLEKAQAKRAADACIAILPKGQLGDYSVLTALAGRLDPAQTKQVGDALIVLLNKLRDGRSGYVSSHATELPALTRAMQSLGPRLGPAQAAHIGDTLATLAVQSPAEIPSGLGDGFAAVIPHLEESQVNRIADALIATLPAPPAIEGLTAVAPRMQPSPAARAWKAVIRLVSDLHPPNSMVALPDPAPPALMALAPRLEGVAAEREGDALLAVLEKPINNQTLGRALVGLIAITPRLQQAQVNRAADALIGQRQKLVSDELADTRIWALATLAPRLAPTHVKRAWDALAAIGWNLYGIEGLKALVPRLESRDVEGAVDALIASEGDRIYTAGQILNALTPRLEPAWVSRLANAWMDVVEQRGNLGIPPAAARGLITLAPRLAPAQADRIGKALSSIIEKSTDRQVHATATGVLLALLPRLEPALRDRISTQAMTVVLNDFAIDGEDETEIPEDLAAKGEDATEIRDLAAAMSSPRDLGKLLSHPACVGKPRECLLQRFEELVCHAGKPVFLHPGAGDGKKPASDQLSPRRFHNLHDAADWIQKNWPDFDLEASCPVTRPSETRSAGAR